VIARNESQLGVPADPSPVPQLQVTMLIIEDEAHIRAVVRDAATDLAHRWLEAATGVDGTSVCAIERPDLVILDLGLPDIDGLAVCRSIRRTSKVPVVVLSARHDEDQKARLLDAGADDYVTKPFSPVEFRARLRAQLRRAAVSSAPSGPLVFGDLEIDLDRRRVIRAGQIIHLTPTEWAVLVVLASNAGKTLTHRQIFEAAWKGAYGNAQLYLRVYITHLRRKVEVDQCLPRHIITDPGVGYRFEP
jgi:two-component system KDP operon response regulator KdpE